MAAAHEPLDRVDRPLGIGDACRLAGSPTRISPLVVNATTDGVSRLPSWLGMTVTSPPSITATTLLVVPRSIPMIFSPSATTRLLSHGERWPAEEPNPQSQFPFPTERKSYPTIYGHDDPGKTRGPLP